LTRFAQRLVVEARIEASSEAFRRHITERLHAEVPGIGDRELAQWILFARRAGMRDVLDGP
jgi:hypothetical protein